MSSAPNVFTVVNDESLSCAVAATRDTVVYVAPGITKPIVDCLAHQLDSQPNLLATVIVDLDPEVYRLGYGTEEGLLALQALAGRQHLELRQQAGVRIGLLVTDGQTLVYSPTPLLIEAGSTSEAKPNAVLITRMTDTRDLLLRACGANGSPNQETPTPQQAEIGRAPATPQQVAESVKALKEIPPKKFNVARIERVYESKIQFVELELTRYRLSSKRVTIPNDLLLGEDKALDDRLKNSFLLLHGEQAPTVKIPDFDAETLEPMNDKDGKPKFLDWSEAELEKRRKALYDDYLINLPRFGHIIMRRNRPAFDQRLKLLKTQIGAFTTTVDKALGKTLIDAIAALAKSLLPRVREAVPQRYSRVLGTAVPSDDDLLEQLGRDLERSFGGTSNAFKPELRCVFKDVTYEAINDNTFQTALGKALGERAVAQLFSEHDAAPEA